MNCGSDTEPGRVLLMSTLLFSTPDDSGYRPLRNDARDGPQTGYWQ